MVSQEIQNGLIRDVENIGHLGVGNIAIHLRNKDDFDH